MTELVTSNTAKLILAILGLIFVLLPLTVMLYNAFQGPPDRNIASVDIIIGEIDTAIRYLELSKQDKYVQVFPLSLEKGYRIFASNSGDKSTIYLKLHDGKGNEIEVEKMRLSDLKFDIQDELVGGNDEKFQTKVNTLSNYGLVLTKKGRGEYEATITYCDDGWCSGLS